MTSYGKTIPLGFAVLLVIGMFSAVLTGTADVGPASTGTRAGSLPVLNDTTVLPDTIMMGDPVNFTVMYNDTDGDVGRVFLRFELLNETRGISGPANPEMDHPAGGNFSEGVEYYHVKTFDLPGTYRYVFNVTDEELNLPVVENGTVFQVILPVPSEGTFSGYVSWEGVNNTAPIADANVIIHYHDNETGNTTYFNTTTNATGFYTRTLPIVVEPYFAYANATGYFDADRYKFSLLTIEPDVEKNFTLDAWEPEVPEDTTGEMSGYVLYALDPVANATVTVIVTKDITEQQNVGGNVTDVIVKIYENLSDVTDETGYFFIEGIEPGSWNVTVTAEDFEPINVNLSFTTELLEGNFTFIWKIPSGYNITGFVSPPNATISLRPVPAEVFYGYSTWRNYTTGEFIIDEVENGTYELHVEAPGYRIHEQNFTVNGSDLDVGTIELTSLAIPTYRLVIGPIVDAEGNPVPNATVRFVRGERYEEVTDEAGYAVFMMTGGNITNNTQINVTKGDVEMHWGYGEEIPAFSSDKEEEKELPWTIAAGVIIVVIILIIVAIITMRK